MGKSADDIQWITVKGRHIPIGAGESKEDAIKRAFGSNEKSVSTPKSDTKKENSDKVSTQKKVEKKSETAEDKKQKQIANAKEQADKLNKEQEYQNSLRQGNKVTLQDGKMTFKGKPVEKINTSDAKKDPNCSLSEHMDEEGNVSEERLKVHRKIIEDAFGEHKPYAPGQEKKALFTGGGGAAGKSMFSNYIDKFYSSNDNPIIIDADEIKKRLKFADTGDDKLTRDLTSYYHEESSAIAKQIYATALQHNFPVMFDGTAKTVSSTLAKIKQAEDAGYKTEINYLFSDLATLSKASIKRYYSENRLVPLTEQLGAHRAMYSAVSGLNDKFDSFNLYDNRSFKTSNVVKGGNKPIPVASNTKGGTLKINDKKAWSDFTKSPEDFTLTDKQVAEFNAAAKAVDKHKGNSRKNNDKYRSNYPLFNQSNNSSNKSKRK